MSRPAQGHPNRTGPGPCGRERRPGFTRQARRAGGALLLVLALFGAGYAGGVRFSGAPAADAADPRAYAALTASPAGQTKSPYELLLECQLPSGAVKVKPDDDRVIPYFANLAAMALAQTRPGDVKAYLDWYFSHLNQPDVWGLSGTIYDYRVDSGGGERSTLDYDSADSYAATFLTLVRAYLDWTGDRGYVEAHLADLRTVAGVITGLQDRDGLVWATASRREKFLMDNCEDFRGLTDWSAILSATGHAEEAARASADAARVAWGIESKLWNVKRGNYNWAIRTYWLGDYRLGELPRESGWKRWYPDTTAQIFPVVSGLLRPSDPRAAELYQNLNEWHPGWVYQVKQDPHPWSILGYAAAVMGDTERAQTFTRATAAVYLEGDGPYTGLSWELAYHLLTVGLLNGRDVPGPGGRGDGVEG